METASHALSGVPPVLQHSLGSTTSGENPLAQNEGCANSDYTTEKDSKAGETGGVDRPSGADRAEFVGTEPEPDRTAVQPGDTGRGTDSGDCGQVPKQQGLELNDSPPKLQSGEPEASEISTEEESGVLKSKDVVCNDIGDGHDIPKSTEDGAGDLPNVGNVLKPSQDSELQSTTEPDASYGVLASKLDAMSVLVQEVDGKDDEMKAV